MIYNNEYATVCRLKCKIKSFKKIHKRAFCEPTARKVAVSADFDLYNQRKYFLTSLVKNVPKTLKRGELLSQN